MLKVFPTTDRTWWGTEGGGGGGGGENYYGIFNLTLAVGGLNERRAPSNVFIIASLSRPIHAGKKRPVSLLGESLQWRCSSKLGYNPLRLSAAWGPWGNSAELARIACKEAALTDYAWGHVAIKTLSMPRKLRLTHPKTPLFLLICCITLSTSFLEIYRSIVYEGHAGFLA